MSDTHSFPVELARRVGVDNAILLKYFGYWQTQNESAGNNFLKGRYWSFNTLKAIAAHFPYWSEKQVRTILANMEKKELLLSGHFGGNDRTTWFSLTDPALALYRETLPNQDNQLENSELPKWANANDQTGNSILPNGQMQLPDQANAFAQTGNSNCPNGQMIYKDTITNAVTDTITNPLQRDEGVVGADEVSELLLEEKKETPQTPKVPAAPLSPLATFRPIPIPAGKTFGDGVLQADVIAYHADNPTEFPLHIYLPFLRYWTSRNGKGDPKLIGVEQWRKMDQWDLDIRLNSWNERDKAALEKQQHGDSNKPNNASRPVGPKIPVPATNGQSARSGFNRRSTS